jgi:predicted DNA-binding protein
VKAKARNRVMLDLPPEIEERIKAIAKKEKCPVSQVAALLIWQGLNDLEKELLDLDQFKRIRRPAMTEPVFRRKGR